ncbi:head-tail adaptor protein [Sphingobium lactosutens]|uniref:head-tail adaptor protein n=1 Tax=Sphingobium lactosutens TaxID=522773 RepID=UPI0009FD70E5|nr:head-tail adaptor protein [Sphingobium lactosutens]
MKASPRRHLIAIEVRTVVNDGYGGEKETWSLFTQEFAAVYFGTGREQRAAAQEGGSQAASFEVLSNRKTRTVSRVDHRIVFDNSVWDVTGAHDLDNGGRRITAIRAAV